MITVTDLTKTFYYAFSHTEVLRGVSFGVAQGETLGIVGQNGAGKTTLMKVLLGFLRPTSGAVSVLGQAPDTTEVKKHIGFLPEHCLLYRHLTGREFLELCASLSRVSQDEGKRRIHMLAERLSLQDALDVRVATYSKGMQQRLGLIQALLSQPALLFLDEPMSGLDPLGRAMFMELLLEEKAKGTTLVLNSHILSDMERLCDRILLLHRGKVIGHTSLGELPAGQSLEHYFVDTITYYDRATLTV